MKIHRSLQAIPVVAFVLGLIMAPACAKKDEAFLNKAKTLATSFHEGIISGDTRRLLDMADYPFNFDNQDKAVKDDEALKGIFDKQRAAMRQKVQPANKIEVITYDDFLAGQEFANVKLSKKEAADQAGRIGLRPGGVLVRCYYFDGKKEDGRAYFLCLHQNSLGELKVTTYYD